MIEKKKGKEFLKLLIEKQQAGKLMVEKQLKERIKLYETDFPEWGQVPLLALLCGRPCSHALSFVNKMINTHV